MERRNFSSQFKQEIFQKFSETGNITLVERKNDLNANMVRRWIKQVNGVAGKASPKTKGSVTHIALRNYYSCRQSVRNWLLRMNR